MKCLLVMPRWSEQENLFPSSGRPYLDLLLNTLGFYQIGVHELERNAPFDPTSVDEAYRLILVQGQGQGGSRLRRSLLSNLGLSLGLDSDDSARLRVMGARPLYDTNGNEAGFAIKRRGRIVAFCERSIWALHHELSEVVRLLLEEEKPSRRGRYDTCWMIEGAGEPLNTAALMGTEETSQCRARFLPSGDTALLLPSGTSGDFKNRLRSRLGSRLYAMGPRPLEEWVGEQLREAEMTVSTAESCTAGLISARMAAVPGSSAYLTTGFVTYSDLSKTKCLDVTQVLLERCGAVSPEVVLAMARGALRAADSDLAVAATGIAGPDGGSTEKPVGTVYLAVASRDGGTLEHRGFYSGNRDRIRYQASQTALHLIRRMLLRDG